MSLVGCLAAAGLMAFAVQRADATPSTPATGVEAIYQSDCAICHGPFGEGSKKAPPLVDVGAASADYELSTGRMPLSHAGQTPQRHPPKYSRRTIAALVHLVATFGAGPAIPTVDLRTADVAEGGVLYRLNCAACHQAVGSGGALVQREAPDLTHATPTQVAEAVRIGPGQMPAFGTAALNEHQVDDVAAYVQQLRHPDDAGGLSIWHLGPVPEGGIAIFVGLGLAVLATRWIGDREPRPVEGGGEAT